MWFWRSPILDPERADEIGLVAVGGTLTTARLLEGYRKGVFPWYSEGDPVLWWSPDPRAILELNELHISRRLQRTLRSSVSQWTLDQDCPAVIRGCAERPDTATWITTEMRAAYIQLHREGYAHSLEVWQDENLIGGIYGVALGAFFAGESMFSRRRDASKIALVKLVEHLRQRGYTLFDLQVLTRHTASLGGRNIPRHIYLERLRQALAAPVTFR